MRQRPEYGSWKTNSANCAANDHLKQPARQSRPSFSPHTRAIGGTFESTFIFDKPANSGNTRPKNANPPTLEPKPQRSPPSAGQPQSQLGPDSQKRKIGN